MYKPEILVSVNPTYYCKNNCNYCYLGNLRSDDAKISEQQLIKCFDKISEKYFITHIDIYGGDISLLEESYLRMLFRITEKYCDNHHITVISDPFEQLLKFRQQYEFNIATSVNVERCYSADVVESDILIYTVLPSMLNIDIQQFLDSQTKDIAFNQYYDAKNANVHYKLSNQQYAEFIVKILSTYNPEKHKYKIMNIYALEDAYKKQNNVFATSHVFISPNGMFSQVKYDGAEEFEYFDDIEYLSTIKAKEVLKFQYGKCSICKYNMHCIAEHLHEWQTNDECCGMKSVLDWYNNHRQKFLDYYGKLDTIQFMERYN